MNEITDYNQLANYERSDININIENKNMNNRLNWTNIKAALVTGLVAGIIATIAYILKVGDVFAIDVHALVNVFALGGLTAVSSFITILLTSPETGKFAGAVKIQ